MKRAFLSTFSRTAAALTVLAMLPTMARADVKIDEATFPDANFRAYLLEQDYGQDGVLTDKEIRSITVLDISKRSIQSLKGIEHFKALESLTCYSNQLTVLNLSANKALRGLYCHRNQLTALNLSANKSLKVLDCSLNKLTALDVSASTALQRLWCDNNQLTALDVSANKTLEALDCSLNPLTALDVSANKALQMLYCSGNKLTALSISANKALVKLNCSCNQLTALNVSANKALKALNCYNNQLTALDLSANKALRTLDCYNNWLQGEGMDALIASLPKKNINAKLYVCNSEYGDGNVCTKKNVADARAKGWTVYEYYRKTSWIAYEGEEPESVATVRSGEADGFW
ncbi:MAG: hypothetical protein IJR87_05925 [Bacteroidaceae bacterium]|nr:hypothetical protein [Bacteroidaceae bacterium]